MGRECGRQLNTEISRQLLRVFPEVHVFFLITKSYSVPSSLNWNLNPLFYILKEITSIILEEDKKIIGCEK